jgi:hypothetical protein
MFPAKDVTIKRATEFSHWNTIHAALQIYAYARIFPASNTKGLS